MYDSLVCVLIVKSLSYNYSKSQFCCDICKILHRNWVFCLVRCVQSIARFNLLYSIFLLFWMHICIFLPFSCTFFLFFVIAPYLHISSSLVCIFSATGLNLELFCSVDRLDIAFSTFLVFLHCSSVHIALYLFCFFVPRHPELKIATQIAWLHESFLYFINLLYLLKRMNWLDFALNKAYVANMRVHCKGRKKIITHLFGPLLLQQIRIIIHRIRKFSLICR